MRSEGFGPSKAASGAILYSQDGRRRRGGTLRVTGLGGWMWMGWVWSAESGLRADIDREHLSWVPDLTQSSSG